MIGYIKGTVLSVGETDEREIIVEAGQSGVGYRLFVTTSVAGELSVGAAAEFHVYTQVREDAIELYGFRSSDERKLFQRLVTVNGVGAKLGLSILDTLTPEALQTAVLSGDVSALKRVPGVGPKVASRLILELESFLKTCRFGDFLVNIESRVTPKSSHLELRSALLNLGCSEQEIELLLAELDASGEQMDFQDELRWCLRKRVSRLV